MEGLFGSSEIRNPDMSGRIVIVGGGFAGVHAAMHFDKALAHRSDIEVVLISRENFILFTPMLHEVAAGDLYPGDIITPLRRILHRVNVVEGEVQSIDLSARRVSCVAGVRSVRREFEFDHLLVALGSETKLLQSDERARLGVNDKEPERRGTAPEPYRRTSRGGGA